jgi:hypothetical protein
LTGVDEQGMVTDEKSPVFGFRNAKTKDAWVALVFYKMPTSKSLIGYDIPKPFSVHSIFTPVVAASPSTKEIPKSQVEQTTRTNTR